MRSPFYSSHLIRLGLPFPFLFSILMQGILTTHRTASSIHTDKTATVRPLQKKKEKKGHHRLNNQHRQPHRRPRVLYRVRTATADLRVDSRSFPSSVPKLFTYLLTSAKNRTLSPTHNSASVHVNPVRWHRPGVKCVSTPLSSILYPILTRSRHTAHLRHARMRMEHASQLRRRRF